MVFQLIVIILILVLLVSMMIAGFSAAPWVPTKQTDLLAALDLAGIKAGETVYDLGCGDGRWLKKVAAQTEAKKVIGFEISVLPFLIAWLSKLSSNNSKKINLKFKSLYQAEFSKADVIYCFLLPKVMKKLENKFLTEMKPGSRLITYVFKLPNVKPVKKMRLKEKSLPIFLYKF